MRSLRSVPGPVPALLSVLAACLPVTACDLVPSQEGAPPHARSANLVAAPPAPSARAPLSTAEAPITAASPAPSAPPPSRGEPAAAAPLATPRLLAKVETGGCGLVSIEDRYLYARAPSCREVLKIDRLTGAIESKKLPSAMLVQTVAGGVAYGCPFGESECKLMAAPLDGGPARPVAALKGIVDGPGQSHGNRFAGVFAPVDASGRPELTQERFTVETVDLASGARTVVFEPVGTGKAHVSAKGVLFDGALVPKENVGSPSWGLWSIEGGSAPRKLPTTRDVSSLASDAQHVYFVSGGRTTWRVGLDDAREEQLTAELESPPDEPNRLGVTPGIAVAEDAVYVSTASTKACWLWHFRKP